MMISILQQGGVTIIPLLLCSVVAVAVSLERLIYLKRAKTNNYNLIKQVNLMLNKGKVTKAKNLLKEERGPVAGILMAGLEYQGQEKTEVRKNLEVVGRSEVKLLEKRIRILEFIASVAPLLGLLGTVLGIIDSFNILQAAQGMASPQALSAGIAEALLSTAIGLIVAIPTMFMHSYLTSLVDRRTDELNRWFVDIVEVLSRGESDVRE